MDSLGYEVKPNWISSPSKGACLALPRKASFFFLYTCFLRDVVGKVGTWRQSDQEPWNGDVILWTCDVQVSNRLASGLLVPNHSCPFRMRGFWIPVKY
jgi:hypothetical protein